jgi:hypothetical protein
MAAREATVIIINNLLQDNFVITVPITDFIIAALEY